MKKKIIVIGGGFAGISAVKQLARSGLDLEIMLFDKNEAGEFLPLLPDMIGRRLGPQFLATKIKDQLPKGRYKFIQEEVVGLDLQSQTVATVAASYAYDFVLIASGSQTNYFGNRDLPNQTFALNCLEDVKNLVQALEENKFDNFVVCGGGYTGIECATNLWLYCRKNNLAKKIFIVERSAAILAPLPKWMQEHVKLNLKRMGIEILLNATIEALDGAGVKILNRDALERALVVWIPGVVAADFIQQLAVTKGAQGRLVVDEYLRINERCFAAGDSAFFNQNNITLRMAVQFALTQGKSAAGNIVRSIKGQALKKFQPLDLGFLLPLANNNSCGQVLGIKVKGILATFLHYLMCIFRLAGWRNKVGLVINLLGFKPLTKQGGQK